MRNKEIKKLLNQELYKDYKPTYKTKKFQVKYVLLTMALTIITIGLWIKEHFFIDTIQTYSQNETPTNFDFSKAIYLILFISILLSIKKWKKNNFFKIKPL